MLLHLFQWLSEYYPNFSVFNYLSLRALLAALTSMIIGFAFAPWVIRELRALKLGQEVRGYGPKSHLASATGSWAGPTTTARSPGMIPRA